MKQYLQEASSEVSPLFGTVTNDTQYIDFDTYRAEHTTFNFNKYEYWLCWSYGYLAVQAISFTWTFPGVAPTHMKFFGKKEVAKC